MTFFGIPLERGPLPAPSERLSAKQQNELILAYGYWQDAGCLVLPLKDNGGKWPSLPGGGEVGPDGRYSHGWKRIRDGEMEPPTTEELADAVRAGRTHGICIILNGNVEMIEIEGRARPLLPKLKDAAERLGESELFERVVLGCTEESPSGGLHFHINVSDGPAASKQVLARRPAPDSTSGATNLAEVIGRGGVVVVAPSGAMTHKTGLPYRRLLGNPWEIASVTMEERERLYRVFRALDEMPVVAKSIAQTATTGLGPSFNRPLSSTERDFNRRAAWSEILVPHGWRPAGVVRVAGGKTGDRWTRPGKKLDTSATTLGWTMCCFSSEAGLPQFQAPAGRGARGENSMTKFDVYAALNHGRDREAATEALLWAGYGQRVPERILQPDGLPRAAKVVAEEIERRLQDSEVSAESVKGMVPEVVPTAILVAVANKELAATGRPTIPSHSLVERDDRRLRCGFGIVASAAVRRLVKEGRARETAGVIRRSESNG